MTQPNVLRRLKPSIVGALYVRFRHSLSGLQTFVLISFPSSDHQRALRLPSLLQLRGINSAGLLPFSPLIDLAGLIGIRIGQRTFHASHNGRTRRGRHREQALLPAEPRLPETWRPRYFRISPDTWTLGVQAAAWITRRHRMRRSNWVKGSFFGARGRFERAYLAHGG